MLIFKTNIMTREEFAERWQHQHYPTMDLRAEMPFYYDIYKRICSVAKTRPIQLARSLCEDAEAIEVLWLGNFQRQRGF